MMEREIKHVLRILYKLQEIDTEFPIQYAICLSEVSLNEGLSLTDLSEKTGMPLSTVSRMAAVLSNRKKNKKAYEFLKIRISPHERRKKQIYLTAKGREIVETLAKTG